MTAYRKCSNSIFSYKICRSAQKHVVYEHSIIIYIHHYMEGMNMLVAADEELRNSLRDIKKLNHFDGRYVLQLKSEIFIAQKMNVESETIKKIIDEIGFDEPIRSVLREFAGIGQTTIVH